jgi:hypothetical protein
MVPSLVIGHLHSGMALSESLRAAGKSQDQVQQAVSAAIQQRVNYGLLGGMSVPYVPGKINQVARPNP